LAFQTCGSHFNASFYRTNAWPLTLLPTQQTQYYANVKGTKAGVLSLDTVSGEATRPQYGIFIYSKEIRKRKQPRI
jgi:hypothetical protein